MSTNDAVSASAETTPLRPATQQSVAPVLFLVFNRPDTTAKVFDAIRQARPHQLFIAADGPRANKAGERERCEEVRQIATRVDWECEVHTLFRPENLGCGRAVHTAINWFFDHVEEGIVLEDDCLPCPEFFSFCTILLERFRHDARIMQIGGGSLMKRFRPDYEYSYYFSNHNNIWGWATWRRAWILADYDMQAYPSISKEEFLGPHFGSIDERAYYRWVFESSFRNPNKTWWDYQWEFVRRLHSGLTVVPASNLIVNLGIGQGATHTGSTIGELSEMHFEAMTLPLQHPPYVLADKSIDTKSFRVLHTTKVSRLKIRMRSLLPRRIRDWWFNHRIGKMLATKLAEHNSILRPPIDPMLGLGVPQQPAI